MWFAVIFMTGQSDILMLMRLGFTWIMIPCTRDEKNCLKDWKGPFKKEMTKIKEMKTFTITFKYIVTKS